MTNKYLSPTEMRYIFAHKLYNMFSVVTIPNFCNLKQSLLKFLLYEW